MAKKQKSRARPVRLPLPEAGVGSNEFPVCAVKQLPEDLLVEAARRAWEINPANYPHHAELLPFPEEDGEPPPLELHLALLTSKYWGRGGVDLTVSFMEDVPADLRDRILSHANKWSAFANIKFRYTQQQGQIRLTLRGDGYWSYLGTDILGIPPNQPTMSLQGFSMNTPESEFNRVVPHEFGHSCGFPHEHSRPEIIALLDPEKVIAEFERSQGWSRQMIIQQILTPLPAGQIRATPTADVRSEMAYSFPARLTKNGVAIPGGTDIDELDAQFANDLYPKADNPNPPPPPPPPPGSKPRITLEVAGTVTGVRLVQ